MKKKEKIWICILAIAVIIFIIVLLVNRSRKDEENNVSNSAADSSQTNGGENSEGQNNEEPKNEEFVSKQEDGSKVNTSDKIRETKRLGGLEISGLTITESNNLTQLLGTIENTSNSVDGGYTAKIIIVDKENNQIIDMIFSIAELQPGQSMQLDCSATFDYSNAYDVKFERI